MQLKSVKAVIFDFNGTLFWDNAENEEAWSQTAKHYRGFGLTKEEFHLNNGKSDREACLFILGKEAKEEALLQCEVYKEEYYKKLCLERKLTLAKGAYEYFNKLLDCNLKLAIASSAPKMNMDWYIPHFHLLDYFKSENIIAGRTDIKGKPEPDIFLLTAKTLGVDIENCIIFEDSVAGLKAARSSGCAKVIAINSTGADVKNTSLLADFSISDFTDSKLKEYFL